MTYSTGEALLLTAIQALSSFDTNNSSRGNWKILDKGHNSKYVILRPGAFAVEWFAYTSYTVTYRTIIEVWQRYTDETTTHTNLYAAVGEIITGLMPEHLINDTTGVIQDMQVIEGGEPEEMWTSGGGPAWLRWNITVQWVEEAASISLTD